MNNITEVFKISWENGDVCLVFFRDATPAAKYAQMIIIQWSMIDERGSGIIENDE